MYEICEGEGIEFTVHGAASVFPDGACETDGDAGAAWTFAFAVDAVVGFFESKGYVTDMDFAGGHGESIATVGTASAEDKASGAKGADDLLKVFYGEVLARCDIFDGDGVLGAVNGDI